MYRKFKEDKLLIATSNKGKISEFENLLSGNNFEILSIPNFNIREPVEDGKTFEDNALIKAKYYSIQTGLPALSDDSGISIEELNDEPGVYSARWAGENGDFDKAMNFVEKKLLDKGKSVSKAYFTCSLALYWLDDHYEIFTGKCHGIVRFPKVSTNNFGYDPIFVPDGYDLTFAQMTQEQKLPISHRYKALQKLIKSCFE